MMPSAVARPGSATGSIRHSSMRAAQRPRRFQQAPRGGHADQQRDQQAGQRNQQRQPEGVGVQLPHLGHPLQGQAAAQAGKVVVGDTPASIDSTTGTIMNSAVSAVTSSCRLNRPRRSHVGPLVSQTGAPASAPARRRAPITTDSAAAVAKVGVVGEFAIKWSAAAPPDRCRG